MCRRRRCSRCSAYGSSKPTEGRVVFTATVEQPHYNGMGVAHGGFAATLLDSALGCCINTLMPPGKRFTTLELKVNLTRPLTHEVGLLRCEANVVHLGSRTATSEGRVVDSKWQDCTRTAPRPASSSRPRAGRWSLKSTLRNTSGL